MKKQSVLLAVLASLACCSLSQASITSATWWSASSGALQCTYIDGFANNTLGMDAVQHSAMGVMQGTIDTDTALDPTLTLSSAINNDTGFAWNGYQVNVVMSVPFTFTTPGPTVNNPPTGDWFIAGVSAPTFQVSGPWAGYYEGTLLYSAGTSIGIGGELDVLYSINFASSTHYILTQEGIASNVTVPEPSALALLAIGGLSLAVRLRRNSRQAA